MTHNVKVHAYVVLCACALMSTLPILSSQKQQPKQVSGPQNHRTEQRKEQKIGKQTDRNKLRKAQLEKLRQQELWRESERLNGPYGGLFDICRILPLAYV